ncbi:GTP-binding domain protein [Leptospira ryugenii]|uniref:GTP-binding domain protein n=1 Tax=Leptospira ryugenii TaxID=1917863 RepID=A0A2P2DW81_9LEPT|nr:GTP-binding protein [Leptospira ryugenii]GBF48883.1 GTP-binding domain protein [Leptospira ryugenii]
MKYLSVGIFAHIDSGKTTLTEQLLYKTGKISAVGSIEDGTTESDSLLEEIKRGISIRSTFYTIPWTFQNETVHIQIIDTPGHIDFRKQVTDILPAMDLALVLLEAGTPVQSQARLMIEECRSLRTPILFFLNKIDKTQDYLDNLIDLEAILEKPPVQLFAMEGSDWKGIESFPRNAKIWTEERGEEFCAWSDETLVQYWEETTNKKDFSTEALFTGLSESLLFPLLAGSAKHAIGVDDLLDFIVSFALHKKNRNKDHGQYVLFRRTDVKRGRFSVVQTKSALQIPFQIQNNKTWIQNVFTYQEDDWIPLVSLEPSQLYILPAQPNLMAIPGDFLQGETQVVENAKLERWQGQVQSPFSLTLEVESSLDQDFWLEKIQDLCWEDPSYQFHVDPELGTWHLSGRGELHLEVAVKRLQENVQKKLTTGSIKIARFERFRKLSHKVALEHRAFEDSKSSGSLVAFLEDTADFSKQIAFEVSLPEEVKNSIETSFWETCSHGFHGFEVLGIRMRVIQWSAPARGEEFLPSLLKVAVHIGLKDAFKENTYLIGPQMDLEIHLDASQVGVVLSELNRRSAKVHSIEEERAGKSHLKATASAENMLGFSGALRNMTKGIGISWERTAFTSEIYAVLKE